MAVPEDKEVDIRVCLEVIFCELDHIFMVLSLVFGCIPFMFFQPAFAAAERPSESESERPPGMDAGIQPLAEFIAEKGAEETERLAAIVHLVAVPEEKPFA